MTELVFKANPIQKAFIESRAEADLFSSRMGEGKSAGLCWAIWYHTMRNPGADWVLIRDTWVNLESTTFKEFFEWFGGFGEYRASSKLFTWHLDAMQAGKKRGTLKFMGLDDPKDAHSLQSLAIAGAALDEPAPAAESGGIAEEIFDALLSRRRQRNMKWYAVKLAQNNPDENHWSYRRFVVPGTLPTPRFDTDGTPLLLPDQDPGFILWHTDKPENLQNLPPGYYEQLRIKWSHRPDFVKRFVEGQFGHISKGQKVTPEWSDQLHLTTGLVAVKGEMLFLLWDFGLNPTCIITQVSPLGHWNIIQSFVGDGIGVEQLIEDYVRPVLSRDYKGFKWKHIGDPAGKEREQSNSQRSAVKVIIKSLGGRWQDGPVQIHERVDPLRAVLTKTISGRGLVQVDQEKAKHVWLALRGGWHYHISRTGLVSEKPVKDDHSHPGDSMGYGAAKLFPLGRLNHAVRSRKSTTTSFFKTKGGLGFEQPYARLPKEALVK